MPRIFRLFWAGLPFANRSSSVVLSHTRSARVVGQLGGGSGHKLTMSGCRQASEREERQRLREEELMAVHVTSVCRTNFVKHNIDASPELQERGRHSGACLLRRAPGFARVNLFVIALSGKSVDFAEVISMFEEMISLFEQERVDDVKQEDVLRGQHR